MCCSMPHPAKMALIEFGEIIIKFTQITEGQNLAPLHNADGSRGDQPIKLVQYLVNQQYVYSKVGLSCLNIRRIFHTSVNS